jgi:hypothetical protein
VADEEEACVERTEACLVGGEHERTFEHATCSAAVAEGPTHERCNDDEEGVAAAKTQLKEPRSALTPPPLQLARRGAVEWCCAVVRRRARRSVAAVRETRSDHLRMRSRQQGGARQVEEGRVEVLPGMPGLPFDVLGLPYVRAPYLHVDVGLRERRVERAA